MVIPALDARRRSARRARPAPPPTGASDPSAPRPSVAGAHAPDDDRTGWPEVVVVEDAAEDYEAIARSFRKLGVQASLRWFRNGEAFVDHLRARAEEAAPMPAIVLLDLNMPMLDGREVLELVGADERLAGRIPIAVLSTSADEADAAFCTAHGAASVMTKPVGLAGLESCLEHVRFFLEKGRPLPPRC